MASHEAARACLSFWEANVVPMTCAWPAFMLIWTLCRRYNFAYVVHGDMFFDFNFLRLFDVETKLAQTY